MMIKALVTLLILCTVHGMEDIRAGDVLKAEYDKYTHIQEIQGPIKGLEHPICRNMWTYQSDYVATTYNVSKHMGHFYELAFRDLYPAPPACDCQHTYKVLDDENDEDEDYHERI